VISDPEQRGVSLATFYRTVTPRLWDDLVESGALPSFSTPEDAIRAEREWECFALYACVRGLVAAGGFNRETAIAIDSLHDAVMKDWSAEPASIEPHDARRARVSERYAEYGAIGQEGGAAGAETVTRRLGEACARHVRGGEAETGDALSQLLGELHDSIAAGAADAVRATT
jgi:hypothetical protein